MIPPPSTACRTFAIVLGHVLGELVEPAVLGVFECHRTVVEHRRRKRLPQGGLIVEVEGHVGAMAGLASDRLRVLLVVQLGASGQELLAVGVPLQPAGVTDHVPVALSQVLKPGPRLPLPGVVGVVERDAAREAGPGILTCQVCPAPSPIRTTSPVSIGGRKVPTARS